MQVEAIYREGRIQFATPIRVRIDIPDDEGDHSADQAETPTAADVSAAPGFIDQLKDIRSLVRTQLQSPANRPRSKEDIRNLRAQAWADTPRS